MPFPRPGPTLRYQIVLLVATALVYGIYFSEMALRPNEILSSVTLDSIKNYFTFAYHARHAESLFGFTGMNYPFGEHAVYADSQPAFSNLIRLIGAGRYSIGILHATLLLSFVVTPPVLCSLLVRLKVSRISASCYALGLTLLSPQFAKIMAGHFSLAYGCVIPLAMLLLLNIYESGNGYRKWLAALAAYTVTVFFIHPYLGFGLSLMTVFFCIAHMLFTGRRDQLRKNTSTLMLCGIFPVLVFSGVMQITDTHEGRTAEPFGLEVMTENVSTLIAPDFGPMSKPLHGLLPPPTTHFEGHSYIGMAMILFSLVFVIFMLRRKTRVPISPFAMSVFLATAGLLLIAFGVHRQIMAITGIESPPVNQFRAVSRFAYFFYFGLPILVLPVADDRFRSRFPRSSVVLPVLFLLLSLSEAHFYFTKDRDVYWNYRNVFNERLLTESEKGIVSSLRSGSFQAILPLPVFHGGSEMYERAGSNNSYLPSMQYALHAGTPIFSVLMSRTSIPETEQSLNLLNTYKSSRDLLIKLPDQPFFVIETNDRGLPDEERIRRRVRYFGGNDSLRFGSIWKAAFEKPVTDARTMEIKGDTTDLVNGIIYISKKPERPFTESNMNDYEKIVSVPAGSLHSGEYVVSFHHHYSARNYRALAVNLILARSCARSMEWTENIPVRLMSGIYNGYGVFEYKMNIDGSCSHDLLLKGFIDQGYRISSLMIRPADLSVILTTSAGRSINNFPEK
jgi:hypothetical protein